MPTCSVRGDISMPRRGWHLWRFASLIPSGCRLPPIHKVMGDHASRAATPAGASLPLGLSGLFILDCHSPCTFPIAFPCGHFRRLFSVAFLDVYSRWLLLDTDSMCSIFLNKLAGWYSVKLQCASGLRKSIPAKSHEKTWDLAGLFVMNNDCKYLIIS